MWTGIYMSRCTYDTFRSGITGLKSMTMFTLVNNAKFIQGNCTNYTPTNRPREFTVLHKLVVAIFLFFVMMVGVKGSPGGASKEHVVKNTPANAGDVRDSGSIPGSGRSPRGGHGNPLQYSCLENPMDRGAWWVTVRGVTRVRKDWSNLGAVAVGIKWYLTVAVIHNSLVT